jgi:hypothetical protein
MWEDIEKHIDTYRDELDPDMPGEHLWEGIAAGLPAAPQSKRALPVRGFHHLPYWKAAAIILLTIGASYFAFHPNPVGFLAHSSNGSTGGEPSVLGKNAGQTSPLRDGELAEIESYYLGRFNKRWEELNRYDLRRFQFAGQFMQELEEVDGNYREIREEITQEGYHEHMVEGLIKTYELKIEILESLLKQIKHEEERKDLDGESRLVPL